MRKTLIGLALCLIMIAAAFTIMCPTTAAPAGGRGIHNGRFENGLNGWSIFKPYSNVYDPYVTTSYYLGNAQYKYVYPIDGDYFAVVPGYDYLLYTSLRQVFYANAGDSISGWAAFKFNEGSTFYNDNAAVNIYTNWGNLVAQPWYRSGSMVGEYGFSDWTEWKWSAPTSGTYILEYGARNNLDNAIGPYAMFDMKSGILGTVEFEPNSLNLDSNGKWVQTKVVGFPDNPEYDLYDIVPGSVSIAGIGVDPKFDTVNANKFVTKTDRLLLEDAIGGPGDQVEVKISGSLVDDTNFAGNAYVTAILN